MSTLIEIANRALGDYGFRQIVLWSPDDIVEGWNLSETEAAVLRGPLHDAMEALPVPVAPQDLPSEEQRLAGVIRSSLGG